jgi:hypothetical protein
MRASASAPMVPFPIEGLQSTAALTFLTEKVGVEEFLAKHEDGNSSAASHVGDLHRIHFPDYYDFLRFAKQRVDAYQTNVSVDRIFRNDLLDFDEAAELAWKGDKRIYQQAMGMALNFQGVFAREVQMNELRSSFTGFRVNVPEFLSGRPQHMTTMKFSNPIKRHLRILVNTSVTCHACDRRWHDASPSPPEFGIARGILVMALILFLRNIGVVVELDVGAMSRHRPHFRLHHSGKVPQFTRMWTTRVFSGGQVINPAVIGFAVGRDELCRRLEARMHEILNLSAFGPVNPEFHGTWNRQETWGDMGQYDANMGHVEQLLIHKDYDLVIPSFASAPYTGTMEMRDAIKSNNPLSLLWEIMDLVGAGRKNV